VCILLVYVIIIFVTFILQFLYFYFGNFDYNSLHSNVYDGILFLLEIQIRIFLLILNCILRMYDVVNKINYANIKKKFLREIKTL
jgi:hypothetical protein